MVGPSWTLVFRQGLTEQLVSLVFRQGLTEQLISLVFCQKA
jgi:hypothetical protein